MLGGIFHFVQILIEHSASNSEDPDQTSSSAASGLGLRYLPTSHKRTLGLYGINKCLNISICYCCSYFPGQYNRREHNFFKAVEMSHQDKWQFSCHQIGVKFFLS